ncbi:hypothetical protein BAE44_0014896 [Dichanthelium oligosanthes]|uniref:TFIIS N-terminal domain-containing protein n=1 Tax=Dichanthelium oligosanthes TaxID=888268 RepID=A0A1E5VG91_9POAL|nr:hypothetical protein BAE44_0014896 [Dichanthelium oligosanthes]
MAGANNTGLEPWSDFFRGRDIYDVIRKAILVAATDSPLEFRRRRDGIEDEIYTAPAIPTLQGRSAGEGSGSVPQVSEKENKEASCTVAAPEKPVDYDIDDEEGTADQHACGNRYGDNCYAFGDIGMDWLQTLADEMDAETQEIDEVLRIKEILLNHHEQSADILFESLRRLMQFTADKIKSTEIGALLLH